MMRLAKYAFLSALAFAVVGTTVSCSREEDEIFDKSAAERLNEAQEADYNILCAAPNGWEMLYFPSNTERGYNFLMEFMPGDKVRIAARNANTGNVYKEETSAFDIIADDGPVLTFNTYNSLFHYYSDPQPGLEGEVNLGTGSGGDYEFKENLIGCFRDLKKYAESCKFSDCTHICEKGCAVIEALNSGLLEPTRYESYAALFNELKDLKPWNGKKRK